MSDDTEYSVFCGGNADPNNRAADCTVVAVDDEIFGWLERRARRRPTMKSQGYRSTRATAKV